VTSNKTNFKIFTALIAAIIVSNFTPLQAHGADAGVLIVKIKSASDLMKLQTYGETELLFNNVYRLATSYQLSATVLLQQSWVEFAEHDQIVKTTVNADDPLFVLDTAEQDKQWYLPKIKVHQAWEKTTGSPQITVAIIDTGINALHEDLNDGRVGRGFVTYCQNLSPAKDNCLTRVTGEIVAGVNSDDNGHGTIIAGLVGAIPNNGKGIAGVNWNVKLMPIKALDSKGEGLVSDVSQAIKWAADNGARVINLSIGWQGLPGMQVLQESISYAFNKGVLVVAAAGNDGATSGGNLNVSPISPVCTDGGQNMVIGVAALDINDRKAVFSSFGSNCIDISAPGTANYVSKENSRGIISTYYDPAKPTRNNLYIYASGSSVAAPLVAGVAALTMATFPDWDLKAVRERIIASADNIDALNMTNCDSGSCGRHLGSGRINAYKAVSSSQLFSAGTVVKSPSGATYLIEKGLKRPVSEYVFRGRFGGVVLVQAEQAEIDAVPEGRPLPPVEGTMIKEPGVPTVYIIEQEKRLPLSYLAFSSRGLRFENVATLSAEEIAGYDQGPDAPVLDGALIKDANSPAVYILNNNYRQLISYFVFKGRGLDARPIAILSLEELEKYQINPNLYPPMDGLLIKGGSSPTVYLVENGARKGMNYEAFINRGYKFSEVQVLPQSEVDQYQLGADIIQ